MNLPSLDLNRKNTQDPYDEFVRHYLELLPVPEHTEQQWVKNVFGDFELKTVVVPVKWGFDERTAPMSDFVRYLDTAPKMNGSMFWHLIRVMVLRFPTKHNEIKNKIAPRNWDEFERVVSEAKMELEWVGKTGFVPTITQEKKDKRNKLVKDRKGSFSMRRR